MSQTIKDNVKQANKFNIRQQEGKNSTTSNPELIKALTSTDGITAKEAITLLGVVGTQARGAVRRTMRNMSPRLVPVMVNIGSNSVQYFSMTHSDFQEFKTSGASYYIDEESVLKSPELAKLWFYF